MSDTEKKNEAAVELGRRGGLKGGPARAASLAPEELSAIASRAAAARWAPKATHAGILVLPTGEEDKSIEIPCFVLENGRRILSQSKLIDALGMSKGGNPRLGGDRLTNFLSGKAIKPSVSESLLAMIGSPIRFRHGQGGGDANGFEATVLADICNVVVTAGIEGRLQKQQAHIARRCAALQTGFMKVGIIALVDEATGYQDERANDELQRLLQAYVVEEMRPWVRRFPTEFFKQLYRVKGWTFREGRHQHPKVVGTFINEWIYKRLPDPVLPRLRELNPSVAGKRKHKHHQFLTEDTGIPHLDRQIQQVTTLMQAANGDFQLFEQLLVNVFTKQNENLRLALHVPKA